MIPHLQSAEQKHDVNYISLYGIKSTDEISQMLCIQAIKDKTPGIARKALDSKGGQIATKVLSAVFKGGFRKGALNKTYKRFCLKITHMSMIL